MVSTPLKNMLVKMGSSFPIFGVKIKHIWVATTQTITIYNWVVLSYTFFFPSPKTRPASHFPPPWLASRIPRIHGTLEAKFLSRIHPSIEGVEPKNWWELLFWREQINDHKRVWIFMGKNDPKNGPTNEKCCWKPYGKKYWKMMKDFRCYEKNFEPWRVWIMVRVSSFS